MCYNQGTLQAYIDKELTEAEMDTAREHLDGCNECSMLYHKLLDSEMLVTESLEGFLAVDRERFDAELAWSKLKLETVQEERENRKEVLNKMRYKKLFTAVASVLALAVLFSFSPVRSMAAEFLTVFRVDKVSVVAITPEDMNQLEKMMREGSGLVDIKNFGRIEVSGKQEVRAVTAKEASEAVDFNLQIPSIAGYGTPSLKLMPGTNVTLAMNVIKVNEMLQSLGSSEKLPIELDGKEFKLIVPSAITAEYTNEAGNIMLVQARGPSIQTSSGADVNSIRKALLSIPALPENLKKQLSSVEDWQHTALIPVSSGQYSKVQINGAEGVFIKGNSPESLNSAMNALVWQKSGVLFVITGEGLQLEKAVAISATMK